MPSLLQLYRLPQQLPSVPAPLSENSRVYRAPHLPNNFQVSQESHFRCSCTRLRKHESRPREGGSRVYPPAKWGAPLSRGDGQLRRTATQKQCHSVSFPTTLSVSLSLCLCVQTLSSLSVCSNSVDTRSVHSNSDTQSVCRNPSSSTIFEREGNKKHPSRHILRERGKKNENTVQKSGSFNGSKSPTVIAQN